MAKLAERKRLAAEAETLRARVAELEAELAVEAETLRARVAELEAELAELRAAAARPAAPRKRG